MTLVRSVAFYLPQFHPTPENDLWWGAGYTEWTAVARRRPVLPGHAQPLLPGELGFYDLRLGEVRERQADLAREHGIAAFCYYHYWFAGRRLLNRPLDEVLASGAPDFPFCLAWANENWSRNWAAGTRDVLVEQRYGPHDDLRHIRWLAPVLADPRYFRYQGRPVLLVYRAGLLPDSRRTTDTFRAEAQRLGLPDLYLLKVENAPTESGDPAALGFDGAVDFQPHHADLAPPLMVSRVATKLFLRRGPFSHDWFSYPRLVRHMLARPAPEYLRWPGVTTSWDNSPRRPRGASIFLGSTPERFRRWTVDAVEQHLDRRPSEEVLLFVNAWNEWAEGAVLEPTERWGRGYLEAHRDAVDELSAREPLPRRPRTAAP